MAGQYRNVMPRGAWLGLLCVLGFAATQSALGSWLVPIVDSEPGGLDHIQVIMTGSDLFISPALFAFSGPDANGNPSPQAELWHQTFLAENPDYAAAEGPSDGYQFLAFAVQVYGNNQVDRPKFHYQAWRNGAMLSTSDVICTGPGNSDWVISPGTLLMGDANLDGIVDLQDFGILKANFGSVGGWRSANFNGDYIVDLQDFSILKDHFGEGTPNSPVTGAPEPATLLLMGVGSAALLRRRRKAK